MASQILDFSERRGMDKQKALESALAQIEPERAGGDDIHLLLGPVAHAHDRALAEGTLDLAQGGIQRLGLVHLGLAPRVPGHNHRAQQQSD